MINEKELTRKFEEVGTRVKFSDLPVSRFPRITRQPRYVLDVKTDKQGEYFEIQHGPDTPPLVPLDTAPKQKHILLYDPTDGRKFLLGHDERHLYVSEVDQSSRNIEDAIVKLAPQALRNAMVGRKKSRKHLFDRRTRRFVRQGEWFFTPDPDAPIDESLILHNEPLQRNTTSKPHICQEMYRRDGEAVYIGRAKIGARSVVTEYTVEQWEENQRGSNRADLIRQAYRNARVWVRGTVKHPDHSTITLKTWHRVTINGEMMTTGPGRPVGFLD